MKDKDTILLQEAYGSILDHHKNQTYVINGVEVHYAPEEDREEDNIKIWHYFKDKDGNKIEDFDFSPYEEPSSETINLWIKLGCPSKEDIRNSHSGNGMGPITQRDLENYAKVKSI
jgi:hypothetical protein